MRPDTKTEGKEMNEVDEKRVRKIAEREAAIVLLVVVFLLFGVMLVAALKDSSLQTRIEALEQKK